MVKNHTTVMKALFLNKLPSTNTYLTDELKAGRLKDECYVVVDYQEKGRGQGANGWQSKSEENLLMSLLFFPAFLSASMQFSLSIVASLAVCEVLKEVLPGAGIKWPNDILIEDRKIAGILMENGILDKSLSHSIIGVGMNVNQEEFPVFPRKATSVYLESGIRLQTKELAQEYAGTLERYMRRLKYGEGEKLELEYLERLFLKDKPSEFESPEGVFQGIIRGISPQGELLVEKGGKSRNYGFQEIRFLE